MVTKFFLVDVEADGPTPFSSVMTEFGVVEFDSLATFHGRIWNSRPSPGNPALSEVTGDIPDPALNVGDGFYSQKSEKDVYIHLSDWLWSFENDRVVFVSDNPAFDFMWIAYGFDSAGMENPFGHSGRRIGDLAAGLSGNWRNTSKWKRLRRTKHDHNPVNDAMGNAEALRALIEPKD